MDSQASLFVCVCVKGEPISHNFTKSYIYINKSFAIILVFVHLDMHLIFYFYFWGLSLDYLNYFYLHIYLEHGLKTLFIVH